MFFIYWCISFSSHFLFVLWVRSGRRYLTQKPWMLPVDHVWPSFSPLLYPHMAHVAEEMLMATLLCVQLEITRQHNRVMAREVSATEGVSLGDQRWDFWPLLPFGWCGRLRRALQPQGHGDWRVDRHRVAAVHGAGPGDPGQSPGHRFDIHSSDPPDLSDLLDHGVLDALSRAATIDCGTRGHDRRVQLF